MSPLTFYYLIAIYFLKITASICAKGVPRGVKRRRNIRPKGEYTWSIFDALRDACTFGITARPEGGQLHVEQPQVALASQPPRYTFFTMMGPDLDLGSITSMLFETGASDTIKSLKETDEFVV